MCQTSREVVGSNTELTIFHSPFIWIKALVRFEDKHVGTLTWTISCAVILQMGGWVLSETLLFYNPAPWLIIK